MAPRNYLIFNVVMIFFSQVYLMVHYMRQKKQGKSIVSLIVLLTIVLLLFENYSQLSVPGFVMSCSVITVIGHSLVGKNLNFYYKSKVYDRGLHLFGSFSFALLTFAILNNVIAPFDNSVLYTFLFVSTLGITIGVFFEIIEFIHDSFSKKNMCQHGLVDTDFDMIFNILGSIIAGVVAPSVFR